MGGTRATSWRRSSRRAPVPCVPPWNPTRGPAASPRPRAYCERTPRRASVTFLGRVHLADPDPGLMIGGIIADFARNPEIAALPPDIQYGVQLHRLIDGFTDRHPVVQRSVGRISPRMGWFAGIVIDIYYDYILGRHWDHY